MRIDHPNRPPLPLSATDASPRHKQSRPDSNLESAPTAKLPSAVAAKSGAPAETKGVLRLLQENHFKGTAALRLRLNFSEQLAPLENTAIRNAAGEGISDLAALTQERVTTLAESGLLAESEVPQLEERTASFLATLEEIGGPEQIDIDHVQPALEGAYNEFTGTLKAWLASLPVTAIGSEEVAAIASTNETLTTGETGTDAIDEAFATGEQSTSAAHLPAELEAWLDGLDETFTAELSTFYDKLDSVSILRNLPEPTGNGVAYEKFLAVYRNAQAAAPSTEFLPAESAATDEVI